MTDQKRKEPIPFRKKKKASSEEGGAANAEPEQPAREPGQPMQASCPLCRLVLFELPKDEKIPSDDLLTAMLHIQVHLATELRVLRMNSDQALGRQLIPS